MQFIQDLLQTFSLSATNGVDEQNMKSSGETIHERRISICIATKIGPLSNFVSERGSSILISDSYTDQQLILVDFPGINSKVLSRLLPATTVERSRVHSSSCWVTNALGCRGINENLGSLVR